MIQSCIVCICWTFSSVCVQMSPQIACLREGIFTLVAFIPFLVTVCYQMFVQNACTRGNKVALAAFVWLFSSVRFQMGSQNACMWGCISQKAAPRLLRGQGNHLQKVVLLHLLHLIPLHHQLTPVWCCTWAGFALCGPPPCSPRYGASISRTLCFSTSISLQFGVVHGQVLLYVGHHQVLHMNLSCKHIHF